MDELHRLSDPDGRRSRDTPPVLLAYLDYATPVSTGSARYHLGLGYVRAYLAAQGIGADQLLHDEPASLDDLAELVVAHPAGIVGLVCFDSTYFLVRGLARRVKARDRHRTIVLGGPSATFSDRLILEAGPEVDFCVRGEGEAAMASLVSHVLAGEAVSGVPSISYRAGGRCVRTAPAAAPVALGGTDDLDRLPSPYLTGAIPADAGMHTGLVSSRGCRYRCTYCNFAAMSRHTLRWHSEARFLAELSVIVSAWRASGRPGGPAAALSIHDDAFTHDVERLKRVCRRIVELGLHDVRYFCMGRIDHLDVEAMELLRDANVHPHFGLESGSPEVLRTIGKLRTARDDTDGCEPERRYLEAIRDKLALAREVGMTDLQTSVIFGLPGDTPERAHATLALVRELELDGYYHNHLAVFPGTALFRDHARHGLSLEPTPHGLPHRTRHAYALADIPILPNAIQLRVERAEAGLLSSLLTGEALAGGRYPEHVLLHDAFARRDLYEGLLSRSIGLATHAVLLDERWSDGREEEWNRWTARRDVLLARPRFVDGALDGEGGVRGELRLRSPLWRDRIHARWRVEPFASLPSAKAETGGPATTRYLSMAGQADRDAFRRTLDLPSWTLPVAPLREGPWRTIDACRWSDAPCPARRLGRLVADGDRVYPCLAGCSVGSVDEPAERWRARIEQACAASERARGCDGCEAADRCSRCPFPGPWSDEELCALVRAREPGPLLGLLRDLSGVLQAIGPGPARPAVEAGDLAAGAGPAGEHVTVLRAKAPGTYFVLGGSAGGARYDGRSGSAARLGESLERAARLIAEGLSGVELVRGLARVTGRAEDDALALLRSYAAEHGLPVELG